MNNYKMLLLIGMTALQACSVTNPFIKRNMKQPELQMSTQDFVAQNLGRAVEEAHSELATLATLRGEGFEPLVPPPDPTLAKHVSLQWTGSAEGVLKELCLDVGYIFQKIGQSAQELSVVVYAENISAYQVIEEISRQVEPQAFIKVDVISRIITLSFPSTIE